MVDKTYGTGRPKPRVEANIADSGLAAEYPNSEVIISGSDYIIKRQSNGVEWYSQGSGPIASRPTAAVFGLGTWDDENVSYKSNSINWSAKNSAVRENELRIAMFGDSTSYVGDYNFPLNQDFSICDAPFPVSGTTTCQQNLKNSVITALYPLATIVFNGGVTGNTLEQMLARDAASVTVTRRAVTDMMSSFYPDVIIYRGGSINNLGLYTDATLTQGVIDDIYNKHIDVLNRLRSVNADLLIDTGFAGYMYNPATTATITAIQNAIVQLNSRIETYINSLYVENVEFLSQIGILSDSTGAYLPNSTPDGVHNNLLSGYNLAVSLNRIIENRFGISKKTRYKGTNLSTNPLLLTTTAETYGTQATGFTAQGAFTTKQNLKVEIIDGITYQTAEFIQTAGGNISGSIKAPITLANMSITANDKFGIEFDAFFGYTDGTGLPETALVGGFLTIPKTSNGQIAYKVADSGPVNINNKFHIVFNPIKIVENAAALTYVELIAGIYITQADANIAKILKVGMGNVRVVKLP